MHGGQDVKEDEGRMDKGRGRGPGSQQLQLRIGPEQGPGSWVRPPGQDRRRHWPTAGDAPHREDSAGHEDGQENAWVQHTEEVCRTLCVRMEDGNDGMLGKTREGDIYLVDVKTQTERRGLWLVFRRQIDTLSVHTEHS